MWRSRTHCGAFFRATWLPKPSLHVDMSVRGVKPGWTYSNPALVCGPSVIGFRLVFGDQISSTRSKTPQAASGCGHEIQFLIDEGLEKRHMATFAHSLATCPLDMGQKALTPVNIGSIRSGASLASENEQMFVGIASLLEWRETPHQFVQRATVCIGQRPFSWRLHVFMGVELSGGNRHGGGGSCQRGKHRKL